MECVICKNVTFHQDEQGNYFCGVCGTQSQEYFAESFELEENLQGSQIRSIKQKFVRAPKEVAAAPDTLDMLTLFQHILKLYTKTVKAHVSEHPEFVSSIRTFWLRYLRLWHDSGGSLTPEKPPATSKKNSISQAPEDDSYKVSSGDEAPPVVPSQAVPLPSPALLLAIIYISIRQLRLTLLLCDIVHMLHSGELPLLSLMQHLPTELTRHCTIAQKRLLIPHYGGTTRYPTVMNLWYHTTRVAELLRIDLAPLNAPLTALHIISKLGLPHIVYQNYCLLTHTLRTSPCLKDISQENQHHALNIMAAIIVSCKMVPNWSCWSYIANDAEDSVAAPVIANPSQLNRINHINLDSYLEQVLATTRATDIGLATHRTAGQYSFNAIMSSYLQSSQALRQHISGTASDNTYSSNNDECYDVSIYAQQQAVSSNIRYLRYPLNSDPGKLLPAYTILLEHCASYLCVSPTVLFEIVNTIDAQMFQCVTVSGEKRVRKSNQPDPTLPPLAQRREKHSRRAAEKRQRIDRHRDVGVPLQLSHNQALAAFKQDNAGEDADVSNSDEESGKGSDEAFHATPGRIILSLYDDIEHDEENAIDMTEDASSDESEVEDRSNEADTPIDVSRYVTSIVEL